MSTFRTSLRILAAHWLYVLVYLLMLSMLGLLMGSSVSEGASDELSDETATVAVIDRDGSVLSRGVARYVGSVGEVRSLEDSTRALQDATAQNRIAHILIVPAGYGEAFQASARQGTQPPAVQTVVSYESAAGSLMDVRTRSYLGQVYDYLTALDGDPAQAVALADDAMEHTAAARPVPHQGTALPRGLVVFVQFSLYPVMAFAIVAIATLMTALGRRPVRSRVSASPVSGRSRGLGLLGACLVVGAVGWAWFVCLGMVTLGPDQVVDSAPLLAVLGAALGAHTLVSASVGFLLGQLGLGENATNAVANIGGMVLAFLAGAWISTDLMPDAVVAVARFTPGYWANQAIVGASTADSSSAGTVLPLLAHCGVCALFAVAVLSVGLAVGRTRARSSL